MDQQNPNPTPNPGIPASTYQSWHDQRRAERWARRQARWQRRGRFHTGWFAGILLVLLGVALLLQNMNIPFFANWWALFILIPAFWAFVAAWDFYQDNSRMTRSSASSLIVGTLLTVLALVLLFNLAVGFLWPAVLIVGGLALLGVGLLPE